MCEKIISFYYEKNFQNSLKKEEILKENDIPLKDGLHFQHQLSTIK